MNVYHYLFPPDVPMADVEASVELALIAIEGLHGEAQTYLDAGHQIERDRRTCVIDASTSAGRDLARVFTALLRRQYGRGFRVERIVPPMRSVVESH